MQENWVPSLKPWPNGLASSRKLKTWSTCDSVWPGFACTCVDLRWLALTLVEIKFARKSTQVFHRLAAQPKSTQVEWRPFVTFWPRGTKPVALKWFSFFCDLRVLARKLSSPFGHPTQVSTQVQLAATCDYLRVRWPGLNISLRRITWGIRPIWGINSRTLHLFPPYDSIVWSSQRTWRRTWAFLTLRVSPLVHWFTTVFTWVPKVCLHYYATRLA